MASPDIFQGDAFSTFELTDALNKVPYVPQWLGTLNLFTDKPVRTETIAIEKRETALAIIPTTPRGAPLPQAARNARDIRDFRTVRVAKGDRINSASIQGIRAFGSETELQQAQDEVMTRMVNLRNDMAYTHENMRLGAIQGTVLDADGSVIRDWFQEWGIQKPAEIAFNLSQSKTGLRKKCNDIVRQMARSSKGAFVQSTRVYGLCGDAFWDAFTDHDEVTRTFLNQQEASDLRDGNAFGTFDFGGITWVNYRGSDDNEVSVAPEKVKFFPVGAPGVFQRALSPGESFDWVNTLGQDNYALTVPDAARNSFVDVEVYSYPLYICTRPEVLLRGKL